MLLTAQHAAGVVEAGGEAGDFFEGVVDVEAGAGAGGDAEALVEGHGAVVAGADGDALDVEGFGDVVGVQTIHREGDEAAFMFGARAEDAQARNISEQGVGVAREQ